MKISTEKLKERIDYLRKQAADVKWTSAYAAQEMLEIADAISELLAVREAQSDGTQFKQVADLYVVHHHSGPSYHVTDAAEVLRISKLHELSHIDEYVKLDRLQAAYTTPPAPAVPAIIPHSVYKVIYDECGGFVECAANAQAIWNACRAAMLQPVSQGYTLPEGYKLVPVDPTPEMIAATDISDCEYYFHSQDTANEFVVEHYRAMLAAAPTPTK